MGAGLQEFAREGLRFAFDSVGALRVSGFLTNDLRERIRAEKPPMVAELATDRYATADEAAELRRQLDIILADRPERERAEDLAIACTNPDAALMSVRALVADRVWRPDPSALKTVGLNGPETNRKE